MPTTSGINIDSGWPSIADPPAEHGEAVDHRRVAVGADQRVGIGDGFAGFVRGPHHLRQIFEVDLMADAGAGRHQPEILERILAPAQKAVALAVALELGLDVGGKGGGIAEIVDLHRMVDDQVDRRQRVDLFRIAAEIDHRLAHRREVDHRRHAGQILHQHPGRAERDLAVRAFGVDPGAQRLDVIDRDGAAVFQPHQVLQQYFQRERQARHIAEPRRLGGGVEAEIIVTLAVDGEGAAGLEAVVTDDAHGNLLSKAGGGDWRLR
jgi:hypothetical protein